jgi:uncharacterized HAD superfamily protein
MIVGLDIDGVVADFLSPFLICLERKTGNGSISAESITDFDFDRHPVLSEKLVADCMEEVSYDPAFWRNLSSLISPSEWRQLEDLNRKGRLVFVTHRYQRTSNDIRDVTQRWLEAQGITDPVVYFTQEAKSTLVASLGIRLFMDDRHDICKDIAEETDAVVLIPNRTYNQSFAHPRVTRIWSFGELFHHLR